MRKLTGLVFAGLMLAATAAPVAGKEFGTIYFDGQAYRTFGVPASVPAGTGTDPIVAFTNFDQGGVSAVGPGDGAEGGRWQVWMGTWTDPAAARLLTDFDEVLAEGMAHFADHCASCHANDGSGNTEMGHGLYPRAPDLRLPATQDLEDHELFYIIENGIRLTGMPAWGNGTRESEDASWRLVHFIRHLPQITPAEIEQMEAMNPKPPQEIRQEIEEERFLQGEDPAPAQPSQPHSH